MIVFAVLLRDYTKSRLTTPFVSLAGLHDSMWAGRGTVDDELEREPMSRASFAQTRYLARSRL